MNETVIGLFNNRYSADRAVDALAREGFERGTISVVAGADSPGDVWSPAPIVNNNLRAAADEHVREVMVDGAVGGAALGGVAGLMAGVAALAVPGLGPLFVAGPFASIFASTAAGVAAGAASAGLGAPILEGLEAGDADLYSAGLREGGVIVAVHTDRDEEAKRTMDAAGAVATREQIFR
jgi:hypothetical protein